jgi:hypothetical protein
MHEHHRQLVDRAHGRNYRAEFSVLSCQDGFWSLYSVLKNRFEVSVGSLVWPSMAKFPTIFAITRYVVQPGTEHRLSAYAQVSLIGSSPPLPYAST